MRSPATLAEVERIGAEIPGMVSWINDAGGDVPEDATVGEVLYNIEHHYPGGVDAYLEDSAAHDVDCDGSHRDCLPRPSAI